MYSTWLAIAFIVITLGLIIVQLPPVFVTEMIVIILIHMLISLLGANVAYSKVLMPREGLTYEEQRAKYRELFKKWFKIAFYFSFLLSAKVFVIG